ncbi:MAG: hypothetical protein ABIW79_04145 [Gemmatimonas sp.]
MATRSVAIVALDGLVADTLALRRAALQSALQSLIGGSAHDTSNAVAGRTFTEMTRRILAAATPQFSQSSIDETLVDLVAVDAARRYGEALRHGVSLVPGAAQWLRELGAAHRIVARADSIRRDATHMVTLASLESHFLFMRCSDDAPRLPGRGSLEGSWTAIDARLTASGVHAGNRSAFELAPEALATAKPFVASVQRPTFRHAITEDSAERD